MGQGYNKKAVPVCTPYILHVALVGAGSPLADPMKGVVVVAVVVVSVTILRLL
jgi:hypothetical protein